MKRGRSKNTLQVSDFIYIQIAIYRLYSKRGCISKMQKSENFGKFTNFDVHLFLLPDVLWHETYCSRKSHLCSFRI